MTEHKLMSSVYVDHVSNSSGGWLTYWANIAQAMNEHKKQNLKSIYIYR
jgi:hypothetical protein